MASLIEEIVLHVSGLGIIFYSPSNLPEISQGSNYLRSHYMSLEQVQSHIQAGDLVSFSTGSPGRFILRIYHGPPGKECLGIAEKNLRLGVRCTGGQICFRDLYDLVDWENFCPSEQIVGMEDGMYVVDLCTKMPKSGILGDDQHIDAFFCKVETLPQIPRDSLPSLVLDP